MGEYILFMTWQLGDVGQHAPRLNSMLSNFQQIVCLTHYVPMLWLM